MAEILLVRFRKGIVGESRRVVHVVPVPDATEDNLTAYCGQSFRPGEAEMVGERGMPCVTCLASAPIPGLDRVQLGVRQAPANPPSVA